MEKNSLFIKKNDIRRTEPIWIISNGSPVTLDLSNITSGSVSGQVQEYRISSLANYLINPRSITLEEKVVGCKVYYLRPPHGVIQRLADKIRSKKRTTGEDGDRAVEEIVSGLKIEPPAFEDDGLNAHFNTIIDMLKPHDSVHKRLARLDEKTLEDIVALCEDTGKNKFTMNLQGSIQEKIAFVLEKLSKKTKVVFNSAYLRDGLFEMRGFDAASFNPEDYGLLIRFNENNATRYCVLDKEYRFEYWVNDSVLITCLHLLEQSLRNDARLREAIALCVKGEAKALKLFFTKQQIQSYSETCMPVVYRNVCEVLDIAPAKKSAITDVLNNHQRVVSFTYMHGATDGAQKLYTTISVMHDMRALEPIRNALPQVFSEIHKRASVSDAGNLYLLDSLKGVQDV